MKFLLIPVEVKNRGFNSRLLLSCFAAEAGFYVIFGSQRSMNRNLNYMPKGVIFDKSISRNKYDKLKSRVDKEFKIVSIDEEGLTSHENVFVYLKQRISPETLELVSKVFTWGENEYSLIVNNYPHFKKKIFTTGNPRIDLLHSNFKEIYREKAINYRKQYGKYIMLPSSFSFKHALGDNFVIKQAWDYGIITNKEEEEIFLNIEGPGGYVEKSYWAHHKMIHKLVKSFPKFTFIIRPHPSEKKTAWSKFEKYKNVKVIINGNIAPWLLGSELCIHNNCTTGLEAYLLGKPVISYRPYKHEICGNHISNGVSLRTKNSDDVIKKVKNILDDPDYFNRNLKIWPIFEKIISISKDKYACEKIIDDLNSLEWPEENTYQFSIPLIKNFVIISIESFKRILSKSELFKHKYAYKFQKFPGSSLNEVKELIHKYRKISGKFKNIRVKKITSDLYLLYKK